APERSLSGLAGVLRALEELVASAGDEAAFVRHQAEATRELILQLCGVVVQVNAKSPRLAAGDTLSVSLSVLQRAQGAALEVVGVTGPDGTTTAVGETLSWNRALERPLTWNVPAAQPTDQPYWLSAPHGALYQPDRARHAGIEPVAAGAATFRVELRLPDGSSLHVERQAMHSW